MTQNKNNILLYYREDKVLYRITKIRNGTTIETDEFLEDIEVAHSLLDDLVENTEKQYGFTGQYSESPKNTILGAKAVVLVKFGNLGVEIGISVIPIVHRYDNLKNIRIQNESDYIKINTTEDTPKKKSLLHKLFSFAD